MDSFTKLKTQLNKYIKKYPLPSRKENLKRFDALIALRNNLPNNIDEYNALRDTLILSNGGFAMKYAIAYCKKINDSELISDLFQQAQIGIIEAVDRFDTSHNVNFTTFAFFYVRKCIIDYIKKSNKTISVNRNLAKYIKHVIYINNKLLLQNDGFTPSVKEIKVALLEYNNIDITEYTIIELLNLIELNSAGSTKHLITNNFDDILVKDDDSTILLFQVEIHNRLYGVSDEYKELINMRFGINNNRPYSLDEIKMLKNLSDEYMTEFINFTKQFNVK